MSFHPNSHLPGCMMPDGGDCCTGYAAVYEDWHKKRRRIEALEAALRACVQYHVKAAADNRAIAAVNQDNPLGEDSLTAAIDHDIAAEDIGDIVRAALAPEQDK